MHLAQGPDDVGTQVRALTHPHLPDPELHSRVVGYLRHAPALSPRFHTDGVWVWPAELADYTAARGYGPTAALVEHMTGRGFLLPDVISDTGLDEAADRVLGAPTPAPPDGVRYLVDRGGDPMPVIRIRPGAAGPVMEAFTPRGWRVVPGVPATFREASATTVCSYLDSLTQRWRSDQLARELESRADSAGPRLARLFDAADASDRPRFSPVRRRIVERQRRERVARYLDAGRLAIRSTGRMADPLESGGTVSVPLGFRTDGAWVWPEGVAHYLRIRGIAPESALLTHIEQQAYRPRASVAEADVRAAVGAVRRGPSPRPSTPDFSYYLDPADGRLIRVPQGPVEAPFGLEVFEPDLRWTAPVGLVPPRLSALSAISEERAAQLIDGRWAALAERSG